MDSVCCCHLQPSNNVWLLKQLELWYNLLFVAHEQTYRLLVRRDSVESTHWFYKDDLNFLLRELGYLFLAILQDQSNVQTLESDSVECGNLLSMENIFFLLLPK